jgi:hypothetical protein
MWFSFEYEYVPKSKIHWLEWGFPPVGLIHAAVGSDDITDVTHIWVNKVLVEEAKGK